MDVEKEFAELLELLAIWLDTRVTRLSNLRRFGTEDPTGGNGPQQFSIAMLRKGWR